MTASVDRRGEGRPLVGYSLSSEEHGPRAMVDHARAAIDAGFTDLVLSDHFHPWIDEQGESPFVWSVLGAIAGIDPTVRLGTAVTCPTFRTHPAVIAQAAATTSLLCDGRFFLGVGSGEQLNEHVTGLRWPPTAVRLEMLEESMALMRSLWSGDEVTHRGTHYTVENARLYSAPGQPVPMPMSAFGPAAARVAARAGDGLVVTGPDEDTIATYRDAGGRGPVIAATKVCYAADEADARRTVHRLWPSTGLPGELSQELRTPAHFEQAIELVDEEAAVGAKPVGPDPEVHVAALRALADAGVDEIYVHQIGDDQAGFLAFYRDRVLPEL